MIAPIKETKPKRRLAGGSLRTARAWVVSTLCRTESSPLPIASWKAWLFIAWIIFVTTCYGLATLML